MHHLFYDGVILITGLYGQGIERTLNVATGRLPL